MTVKSGSKNRSTLVAENVSRSGCSDLKSSRSCENIKISLMKDGAHCQTAFYWTVQNIKFHSAV